MKKILILLMLLVSASSAFAKNVQVECLTPINSEIESMEFDAKILKDAEFKSGVVFKKNDIVKMQIKDIVSAKFGGRNAYIVVHPKYIIEETNTEDTETEKHLHINDSTLEGKTTSIKVLSKADIKQHIHDDWKDDLKKAGKGVTKKVVNTALPCAEQAFQVSKGLLKPNEGETRLQSAANNLIDDSPLKHLKKGHDIDIRKGDKIIIKFYHTDIPQWRFIARGK